MLKDNADRLNVYLFVGHYTSGLSLSHRYHGDIRLRGSEYFQRKGLAVF